MSKRQERNPIELFSDWMKGAGEGEFLEPDAASLATADAGGVPSVRMVLLKDWSDEGFVFYTNLASQKAREMRQNPHAALCLYWKSTRRQVRIDGRAEQIADDVADAYFATRDRGSQIGAWASRQSSPLEGRFALEREVAKYTMKFGVGKIPRPDFWSGFRIIPRSIEFWSYGKFRLHNRLLYHRQGDGWRTERLFP